jgi:energy-coupling factor transporter ATP-binding protein EcfA2
MTGPATSPGARNQALAEPDDAIHACLRRLLEAADAADGLGISTEVLRATQADAAARIGFPGDAYVLAFVGGTGVGKSSLLNALAGVTVSRASVRRPTTSAPIAWVPAEERVALAPLLAWIGVEEVEEHTGAGLGPVAILDLPDMDSVAGDHRAKVEAILPRVDAVAWVTDPEKYHDAALHDDFLRAWLPRLARQTVLVNKADRLAPEDGQRIRKDLEADLRALRREGERVVPVLLTAASPAAGGGASGVTEGLAQPPPRLEELRGWLAEGVAAKRIIRGRVAATVVDLGRRLAAEAGIDPRTGPTPILPVPARSAAIEAATTGVLRALDLGGLERQAEAATRARARARGTGPMGHVTSLIYRLSGRETRVADPDGYLIRWRERGSLAPAVESLRGGLALPIRDASPAVRPALATTLEPAPLRQGLERAVDRAIAGVGSLEAPTSRWWSFIGLLQTVATVALVIAAAWVVLWVVARPPVSSAELPIVGSVPMPFVALLVTMLIGYLLARLLGLHAGHVGRRWARGVRDRVAAAVGTEVHERGLAPLDALEDARRRLWAALADIERRCAGS